MLVADTVRFKSVSGGQRDDDLTSNASLQTPPPQEDGWIVADPQIISLVESE